MSEEKRDSPRAGSDSCKGGERASSSPPGEEEQRRVSFCPIKEGPEQGSGGYRVSSWRGRCADTTPSSPSSGDSKESVKKAGDTAAAARRVRFAGDEEGDERPRGRPLLRVAGAEATTAQLDTPLSDIGLAAQCVVELLCRPRASAFAAAGRQPAHGCDAEAATPPGPSRERNASGGLQIWCHAPSLGAEQRVCVELAPDATVGELAAAAALQLGVPPLADEWAPAPAQTQSAPAPVTRKSASATEGGTGRPPRKHDGSCGCC
eukprot:TRINITY_DN14082_c0_g1_i1.p2 TRINITY_DN14082_c0_g1~~TRINITY_DN14082_c0_g1_i1.p2  ORF type:complete len:263 (+),score=57.50 TRINITY_DN14082_c0_g1_i1:104-892(+)